MTSSIKFSLLAGGLGLSLQMAEAQAVVALHYFTANAVNYCQAFTPGPANTIRNRVIGAENVGTAPVAIACAFHSMGNGAPGLTPPTSVAMYFANNNASGFISITCTLLTGYQGQSGVYAVTKTRADIAAGASQAVLNWNVADNPNYPSATSLGNSHIGINCTLPPGAVANDIHLYWNQDNGVGN